MTNTNKPLLIKTLENNASSSEIPIWLMRQAGRYLPEYRTLKEKYTFNQLSENPELAAEVTIQPLLRFNQLDAAIFFADILTPAKALGFEFHFNPGPILANPIKSPIDIENLFIHDIQKTTGFVFEGISKVRHFLDNAKRETRRAMLGFAATPWTLACYLIDQGVYKQHLGTKIFALKHPTQFNNLCNLIAEVTIEYLKNKFYAGADAVQLFDTWATLLNPVEYEEYSGKWIRHIISTLRKEKIPVTLYTQGDHEILKIAETYQPTALSIDWRVSLNDTRKKISETLPIQGNIDPCLLFADVKKIESVVKSTYQPLINSNIIANLGHGILPGTPIERVEALLNTIKSL